MRNRFLLLSFLLLLIPCACSRKGAMEAPMDQLALIPYPAEMEKLQGTFAVSEKTLILAADDESVRRTAAMLSDEIVKAGGPVLKMDRYAGARKHDAIHLLIDKGAGADTREAYTLRITAESLVLTASSPEGLFRGAQSIRQMLAARAAGGEREPVTLPCVMIRDEPRFPWRGLNLDCSRHFYSKDFIKRYLDLLALYKMNIFHWHLVDDQGWRLEIKKYPALTGKGAVRKEGGSDYGGFYTQDDVREIIRYAGERFITVVPEIEMPGHCQAALAAYPELSCTGGPFAVSARWGIHKDVYCAGGDETFRFLENVLTEVIALFPGTYIHVGGDECLKFNWKRCPKCQARIKAQGLKDEKELQSYFIRRMEKFLLAHNRRLIGWDEILEGGLAPSATVQSWRGFEGALEAVKQGHEAIVSPTTHTYFDYGLAVTGLAQVYSFDPVPEGLTKAQAAMILGSEANMWSEFATQDNVDGKLFPRILALCEVVWTPAARRNFDEFHARLQTHYRILEKAGVQYGGESEPGFFRIGYFFRDLGILFGILADDPEVAWHTVKLYLGMGGGE